MARGTQRLKVAQVICAAQRQRDDVIGHRRHRAAGPTPWLTGQLDTSPSLVLHAVAALSARWSPVSRAFRCTREQHVTTRRRTRTKRSSRHEQRDRLASEARRDFSSGSRVTVGRPRTARNPQVTEPLTLSQHHCPRARPSSPPSNAQHDSVHWRGLLRFAWLTPCALTPGPALALPCPRPLPLGCPCPGLWPCPPFSPCPGLWPCPSPPRLVGVPVHRARGGWQWGQRGKVYARRADAVRQGRAAYASGYQGGKRWGKRRTRRRT